MIMERRMIRFSGKFGSGRKAAAGLQGRLIMYAPDYLKRTYSRGGIDFDQMSDEITAITPHEERQLGFRYGARLAWRIRSYQGPLRTTYKSRK
jgi:hypothetical protein